MEQKIKRLLEKHYKRARVIGVYVDGDTALITVEGVDYTFAAKRILEAYAELRAIRFDGGFITHYFTRETLRWAGFNIKTR